MKRVSPNEALTKTQPEPKAPRTAPLPNERESLLAQVLADPTRLRQCPADRDFVLEVVTQRRHGLKYAPADFQADKEDVVLAAVTKYGTGLQFAPKELRADPEVVLAVVKNDGSVLRYASKELRANGEVVLAAVNNCGLALL